MKVNDLKKFDKSKALRPLIENIIDLEQNGLHILIGAEKFKMILYWDL